MKRLLKLLCDQRGALFLTMAEAEARALELMDQGKLFTNGIVAAHSGRTRSGVICVRVQRALSSSGGKVEGMVTDGQDQSKAGAWEELTDSEAT
jgi:hypothetical protein